jgi:long-chain acyl-CoA synthetase
MLNLASVLEYSVSETPDKTALIFNESRLSYRQVNAMANQVAGALKEAGIQKGDKVALSCPNLPYMVFGAFLALIFLFNYMGKNQHQ